MEDVPFDLFKFIPEEKKPLNTYPWEKGFLESV